MNLDWKVKLKTNKIFIKWIGKKIRTKLKRKQIYDKLELKDKIEKKENFFKRIKDKNKKLKEKESK